MFKFLSICYVTIGLLVAPTLTQAQTSVRQANDDLLVASEAAVATTSAESTESARLASPSADIVERQQQRTDQDITETSGQKRSVLASYLDDHPIGAVTWHNIVQKAIRKAIASGLPANVIVILLIFPLIASLVAFSRHVIGLKGFGIYIPAVLSVAFVSTGITTGIVIFTAVLVTALVSRPLMKKLRLPLLPRTAMLLLSVSVAILALLLISAVFKVNMIVGVSIFPLLIIILLTENFMETQLFSSQKEALQITFETLLIAILGSLLIGSEMVQKFVILRPELVLLGAAIFNLAIGKYTGLRLLEYWRFRDLLDTKGGFKTKLDNNNSEEEE